jgi:hypothetical protein
VRRRRPPTGGIAALQLVRGAHTAGTDVAVIPGVVADHVTVGEHPAQQRL